MCMQGAPTKAPLGMVQKVELSGGCAFKLGDWIFNAKIGNGGFAAVWAARKKTGERAAVKVIDRCKATKNGIEDALKEADIQRALNHVNVVRTVEVMQNRRYVFIVQELAAGGDLTEVVPSGVGLEVSVAQEAFWDMMQGVKHCHGHGVAHLDIKPANVLRGERGAMKLCDFGLAKKQDGELIRCGTPCFAAPEIIDGTARDGYAVDMWACGITLCFMLTGALPWKTSPCPSGEVGRSLNELVVPTSVPDTASDLIRQLLCVDPAKRITAEGVVMHPWLANVRAKALPKAPLQRIRMALRESLHSCRRWGRAWEGLRVSRLTIGCAS
eukprot:TRINITY_DN24632_c0_g1_i1.p3 TRINITY_DN24632_c0_g1~~TRINITY_DN24632_c0_g1_i1.p3  ORF type:complete len:327 (+),score=68.51 TRINITY_DN24632_c0_g1_i1:36-1016(+)